ncbi:MAG: acyl-CoA dehydrogenase family protein [Anaerolineae bacterium]|jgi:hypothetical protein|nr:acyl-CoA dehydrogenase family protein [Anaerolineae bacterium]
MPNSFLQLFADLLPVARSAPDMPACADWWQMYRQHSPRHDLNTILMAARGGFLADRAGYAFMAGYQAALRRLVPALPPQRLVALCVTETGGQHPRDLRAHLAPHGSEYHLGGRKTFVTGAQEAEVFLVVAVEGVIEAAHKHLVLVRLERPAAGLTVTMNPPLPFIPEISHGELHLEAVRVTEADVLEGDGYTRYVKPFRTLEDVHVLAALAGYLCRLARLYGWPTAQQEDWLALLVLLNTLAHSETVTTPGVHLALAGALRQFGHLLAGVDWSTVPAAVAQRWQRDRPLLDVAAGLRQQRTQSAWQALTPPG